MVAERWSAAPESLSDGSEDVEEMQSVAPDVIDAAGDVAGWTGDETRIGAEDVEARPGDEDASKAEFEIEVNEVGCRNQSSGRCEVQKTVQVRRVQFLDRAVDVPVSVQRQEECMQNDSRVFIMDDRDELVPEWLNTVKVVIDSEDLPLNVCRETLLQNKILRVIKKNHVTKYLEMLAEIAELNFVDDADTAELLRFNTSGDEQINLKEYVDRMKEGQNDICYITGENIAVVSSSSFSEDLCKKGYEVLYIVDPMDEYAVHQPKEFNGMRPKSTTKKGLDLGDQDEKKTLEELKDSDSFELFDESLPSPSVIQVQSDGRGVVRRARAVARKSSRSPDMDRAQDEDTSLANDIKSHAGTTDDPTAAAQHRSTQQHNNHRKQWQQAMQTGERERKKG